MEPEAMTTEEIIREIRKLRQRAAEYEAESRRDAVDWFFSGAVHLADAVDEANQAHLRHAEGAILDELLEAIGAPLEES